MFPRSFCLYREASAGRAFLSFQLLTINMLLDYHDTRTVRSKKLYVTINIVRFGPVLQRLSLCHTPQM